MKRYGVLIVLIWSFSVIIAEITLPTFFTESMVLQHGKQILISGKAEAGKVVYLSFGGQSKTAMTDVYGTFELQLDTLEISSIPQTLRIKCNNDSILINDILVGDVFLLSGQSNMAWKVSSLDANQIEEVRGDADYPNIRYYEVAKNYVANSVFGNDGVADIPWRRSNATSAVAMSAVGFYYGRQIYKDKNIPIGLIDCSQGSSSGDAWISENYIDNHPELQPYLFAPVKTNAQYYKNPGILHKQMLSRVLPYPISGILWYQGEANAATYDNYKKILPAVIRSFRESYNDNTLPFVVIQLSAFENPNSWPHLREIQDSVANTTPYSAMVSSIDVGTANQIHPKNKRPVGERCALAMRKLRYGEDIVYTGPSFDSVRFENNKAVITFNNASGLKTKTEILAGFEICDDSYLYQSITGAEISGNQISVWREGMNTPKAVRYGWSNFPPPNLYNDSDLPANPFRTTKQGIPTFTSNVFYVSATEGDDANEGTLEMPFATINRAASVVNQDNTTIYVASGDYVFNSAARIKPYNQIYIGEDAANTIFDGNDVVSLIDGISEMQNSGKKLQLQNLQFKNGYLGEGSVAGGAAISMGTQTDLDVSDCYFVNNNAVTGIQTWGGAIYFNGNTLLVKRCFFEDNTSMSTNNEDTSRQGYGGAITVRHSLLGATDAIIKNSTFYNNIGNTKGGAVYFHKMLATNDDATFVVQNCVFLENKSVHGGPVAKLGAAIALSSGVNTNNKMSTIILTNNTICNNNMIDAIGNPLQKNAILLEGSRYVSYMANNIITSSYMTAGEGLFANLPAPVEYGKNNIIDEINVNINGTDFTTNAAALNNSVVTVRPDALKVSTTLTGYPLGPVFNVPYLTVNSGSLAIDGGVNSYTVNTVANPVPADPVEFVEKSDIRGLEFATIRDLGAWEYDEETANRSDIVYTTAISLFTDPITNTLSVITDVDIVSIALFDGTGRFVCQKTNQKTLYTDKLFRGVYVIQIDDIEGNTYRLKFIKK